MAISQAFQDAITAKLGNKVSFSDATRQQAGEVVTHHPTMLPDAVVFAEDEADVVATMLLCRDHKVPIIPQAQRSSLEGHTSPMAGGVAIDLNAMKEIIEVNEGDLDCRVQAGVTRKQLNEYLRDTGLFFPIDPGADASIGGMTATRASGTNAVRYGTMRENVMGVTAVMADGSVVKTGTRARKSSAGYDITRLLVGSEGTLGIITEIQLKLMGQPEAISAAVCAFDTLDGAVESVQLIIQMGIPVARVELLDALQMRGMNAYSKMDFPEKPHLFFEFHGSDAAVKEQAETVGEICSDNGGSGFSWATQQEERNKLWQARHDSYWAGLALRPGCMGYATDVCVPISELAATIKETVAKVEENGLMAPVVGHVGDGNFHLLFLLEKDNAQEFDRAMAVNTWMIERALSVGGTCTGEHGVGYGKKKYLAKEAPTVVPIMQTIKKALDPHNIMNPGKIFDFPEA